MVTGQLQSLVKKATAAQQLVAPKSVMRLQVPMLPSHDATVERALGVMPGREQDALQMVLSETCQYRAF